MVFFPGVVLEDELEEAVDLGHVEDHDVLGVVLVLAGADFDLLDVAEVVILGAASHGDTGVEEGDEFGAACQVVLGDGLVAADLRCVGDDDGGEAVLLLQADDLHHEFGGRGAFLGVVAGEGQVVEEDVLGAFEGGHLDGEQDLFFEVGSHDELRVDLGAHEVLRELVDGARVGVGVAHLELLVGQLQVDVEDLFFPGDALGYLDGQDGLASIALGKEDGVLVLDDEVVEPGLGVGPGYGVVDPGVG